MKIYSFAVNKRDYDEVVPADLRKYIGSHYSWAIRHLLSHLVAWRISHGVPHPLRYMFDWMEPSDPGKREIETIMEQAERQAAKMQPSLKGEYVHFDFLQRQEHPGLQCVDVLAWMFYQLSLNAFRGTPSNRFAQVAWSDFSSAIEGDAAGPFEWITAMSITRKDLKAWTDNEAITHKARDIFLEWEKEKTERHINVARN